MAISAQRYKYLDNETNVPTLDLTALSSNAVYNLDAGPVSKALENIQANSPTLDTLTSSLADLRGLMMNGPATVINTIKNSLTSAINSVLNLPMPDFAKDILNKVSSLDTIGLTSFLKELLGVGASFLCNNIDFLKMFMLGYAINGNILGGLMIGLLLSWLDRICRPFTNNQFRNASNRSVLGMLQPYNGTPVTNANAFPFFTNSFRDMLQFNSTGTPPAAMSDSTFLSNVLIGNGNNSLLSIRASEPTMGRIRSYKDVLTQELTNHAPNSQQYRYLLSGIGGLSNVPLVSDARRANNIQYSNLNDQLGRGITSLVNTNIDNISTYSYTDVEKSLLVKINQLKVDASGSSDFMTRGTTSGAYDSFDFSSILPGTFTTEELDYLNNLPGNKGTSRFNDLHPTTEVFVDGGALYA